MARNLALRILRGTFANIPTLAEGEIYFCTDTLDVYIGGASGNVRETIPAYGATGARLDNVHTVSGTVLLSSGSATITLSGSAAFANATSYVTLISVNKAKRSPFVVQNDGSSFTVSSTSGDLISYFCIGN